MSRTLDEAIYEKYIRPTERKRQRSVGVELEFPLINRSRRPVDIPAVQEIVKVFAARFGFTGQCADDNGNIYSLTEPVTGDNLSFDCSFNTLELSFGKEDDITLLHERYSIYTHYLQSSFGRIGHILTGMGINPYHRSNDNIPIANDRYRMLFHHLQTYSEFPDRFFHKLPYFGMMAAASQVQLDVERDDIIQTFRTMDRLEPYKALLFANSYYKGLPELIISRDYLWSYSTQGYNPHNLGMYETELADLDEYIDYVKSQSMYCVGKQDRYYHFTPVVLNDYIRRERITGQYYADGGWHKGDFAPEVDDIAHLRTFKFSDLTYRGTIEYRSACEQPMDAAFTVAALHAGLAEKLGELTELLDNDRVIYHRGYSAPELRELLTRRELPTFADRDAVSAQLTNILEIAYRGLLQRRYGEEVFLRPLFERAEALTNPAKQLLAGLERGDSIESWIERFADIHSASIQAC